MGLPSLVVTLAGLIGWRGAGRILVEDRSIGDFPEWFENVGQEPVIGRISFAARSSSSCSSSSPGSCCTGRRSAVRSS